jgi:hypothetical protein
MLGGLLLSFRGIEWSQLLYGGVVKESAKGPQIPIKLQQYQDELKLQWELQAVLAAG